MGNKLYSSTLFVSVSVMLGEVLICVRVDLSFVRSRSETSFELDIQGTSNNGCVIFQLFLFPGCQCQVGDFTQKCVSMHMQLSVDLSRGLLWNTCILPCHHF